MSGTKKLQLLDSLCLLKPLLAHSCSLILLLQTIKALLILLLHTISTLLIKQLFIALLHAFKQLSIHPLFLIKSLLTPINPLPIVLLLLINNLSSLPSSSAANSDVEQQALLSFKAGIELDPLGILTDWDPKIEPDICRWNGVGCSTEIATGGAADSDPVVTVLSLPRSQLQGKISPDLGRLAHLRHLNLHNNRLTGPLPPPLFNATRIESLFLFSNQLSGEIPPEIARLSGSLQSLDLSQNDLSGAIPQAIALCSRLSSLSLSQNRLSGPVPAALGTVVALRHLDLSSNTLSGAIPASLGRLRFLVGTLNLSHNALSGTVPASLAALPPNFTLDVSFNRLSGPIPRAGSLANQNITAFVGNAGLCGAPLTYSPCRRSPQSTPTAAKLSRRAITAVALGSVAGLALLCLAVTLYCIWRKRSCSAAIVQHYNKSAAAGGNSKVHSGSSATAVSKPYSCSTYSSGRVPSWLCASNASATPEAQGGGGAWEQQGELVALDESVDFNLDELLKASAYVVGKSGGGGIVYRVVLSDEETVAVRRLGEAGNERLKEFQAEVEAIARVRHPNVVRLRAYYWAADEKLLVYDYIPNGSLVSALHGQTSRPLHWPARLKIAKGAARGLAYIHEQGSGKAVHGDVRPTNILLDKHMDAYVADYGLRRLIKIAGSGISSYNNSSSSAVEEKGGGALRYEPPEAGLMKRATQKGDVYSLGMVLLELMTGSPELRSPGAVWGSDVGNYGLNVAQWVEAALSGKKPLLRILDPCLVHEMHRADEMLALLKIALACVALHPDQRPSSRHVSLSLQRIAAT